MTVENPRILGHRGTKERYTENGIQAFQYVMANGITGFETDFRMTKDGVVIVMHDQNIQRTTTGQGIVEEMTLAEIKQVRMINSDETVPTAEELFALFENRQGDYIELEMKARYGAGYDEARMDAYLEQLYTLAKKYLKNANYMFTCFDTSILKRLKQMHPDAKTGLIMAALTPERVDAALDAQCYCVAAEFEGTEQATVDRAKASGLKVNLWHSETLELWEKARSMGADVSTNNHPVEVITKVRELLAKENGQR